MTAWLPILAASLSGVLLAFISPPANLHWLHWVSFLPLFWALKERENATNALLGYITGYLGVFSCFFWLAETVVRFSNVQGTIALLAIQLYGLAFGLPYALVFGLVHPLRRRLGLTWVLVIPCLQVLTEWLVPSLFPYYQGVSQYRVLPVWQIASVTGVYGVTWLVLFTNCVVAEMVYRQRERRPMPWVLLGAACALFFSNVAFGLWRIQAVETAMAPARTLQVAILQQDVTMEERLSGSAKEAVESWFRLTARLKGKDVDLVVWPEGSSPYNPPESPMKEAIQRMMASHHFEFLIGGGTREITRDTVTNEISFTDFNSCYFFGREGEVEGRYDKIVPLPFGEYIPLASVLPFLRTWIQGPGNFQAGTEPTIFQGDGFTFATPICYEAILHDIVRRMASADLFVNITNDAWFGDTASPHQHAMLAAVRSVEFGRPTLRLAYTGVSMIVEPTGRIVYETRPFAEVVDVVPLRLEKVDTLYLRFGDWFCWLCLALTGLAGWFAIRRPVSR